MGRQMQEPMNARNMSKEISGFAGLAQLHAAPDAGVFIYRCFDGVHSTEWGTGYFALEKPASVVDAELRFNIVHWGNLVRFVSTFRIRPGFHYYSGAVEHGAKDLRRPATQIFIEGPLKIKLDLVRSRELLRHDAFVINYRDPALVGRRSN